MTLRKNLFCLVLAIAALVALAVWHFNWECARHNCYLWSVVTPAQAQIGPPAFYTFAPAPAKVPEPLPPGEMVEPPPGELVAKPELDEPVYLLGELPLDIPVAPLDVTIDPFPPVRVVRYYQSCYRSRHRYHRTECSDFKLIPDQ